MRKKFTKESFWTWVQTKLSGKGPTEFYKKITGENPPKS